MYWNLRWKNKVIVLEEKFVYSNFINIILSM